MNDRWLLFIVIFNLPFIRAASDTNVNFSYVNNGTDWGNNCNQNPASPQLLNSNLCNSPASSPGNNFSAFAHANQNAKPVLKLENNSVNIVIDAEPDSLGAVNGFYSNGFNSAYGNFDCKRIYIRVPAENGIDITSANQRADIEIQIKCIDTLVKGKKSDLQIVILSFPMKISSDVKTNSKFMKNLSQTKVGNVVSMDGFEKFMNAYTFWKYYYNYAANGDVYPCIETYNWLVFKTELTIDQDTYNSIFNLIKDNPLTPHGNAKMIVSASLAGGCTYGPDNTIFNKN